MVRMGQFSSCLKVVELFACTILEAVDLSLKLLRHFSNGNEPLHLI